MWVCAESGWREQEGFQLQSRQFRDKIGGVRAWGNTPKSFLYMASTVRAVSSRIILLSFWERITWHTLPGYSTAGSAQPLAVFETPTFPHYHPRAILWR